MRILIVLLYVCFPMLSPGNNSLPVHNHADHFQTTILKTETNHVTSFNDKNDFNLSLIDDSDNDVDEESQHHEESNEDNELKYSDSKYAFQHTWHSRIGSQFKLNHYYKSCRSFNYFFSNSTSVYIAYGVLRI